MQSLFYSCSCSCKVVNWSRDPWTKLLEYTVVNGFFLFRITAYYYSKPRINGDSDDQFIVEENYGESIHSTLY